MYSTFDASSTPNPATFSVVNTYVNNASSTPDPVDSSTNRICNTCSVYYM
jgi:hypothetical protein